MDFDEAKENIQPLASGRDAVKLEAAIHAETDRQFQDQLIEERKMYEMAIHNYVGDDPLEPWYKYIQWVEQSYPKSGKESALMELLAKCLEKFESDEQYRQDQRMVKLYIRYISEQQNPPELFELLYNGGIGTMVADLYICWAHYYDYCDNFQKTEAIYQKGLCARAQPADLLENAHKQFGISMSQRILYKDETSRQKFLSTMEEQRSVLTSLRPHKHRHVGSIRTGHAIKSHNPGRIEQTKNDKGQSSNVALNVFQDENRLPSPGATALSPGKEPVPLTIFQTILNSTRKQENRKEPGPWTNSKSKNRAVIPSATCSKKLAFAIMADDELIPMLTEDMVCKGIQLPEGFVSKNDRQVWNDWDVPIHRDDGPNTNTIAAYPKFHLYPKEGVSFSLDEFRAYRWYKKRNMENNFTREHDFYFGNGYNTTIRLPPFFHRANDPQSDWQKQPINFLEAVADGSKQFSFDITKLYTADGEYSPDEILQAKWLNGDLPHQAQHNMDLTEAFERKEDLATATRRRSMAVGGRKSILPPKNEKKSIITPVPGPNRKSILPTKTILKKSSPEVDNHISNYPTEGFTTNSVENAELVSKSVKRKSITMNEDQCDPISAEHVSPPAIRRKANTDPPLAIQTTKFELFDDNENAPKDIFKTPKVPSARPRFSAVFQDEDTEENGTFLPNETCTTQAFNYFIKSQPVSTPIVKRHPQTENKIEIFIDNENENLSPIKKSPTQDTDKKKQPFGNQTAEDLKENKDMDGSVPSTNHTEYMVRKKLSAILETTEDTNTISSTATISSTGTTSSKSSASINSHAVERDPDESLCSFFSKTPPPKNQPSMSLFGCAKGFDEKTGNTLPTVAAKHDSIYDIPPKMTSVSTITSARLDQSKNSELDRESDVIPGNRKAIPHLSLKDTITRDLSCFEIPDENTIQLPKTKMLNEESADHVNKSHIVSSRHLCEKIETEPNEKLAYSPPIESNNSMFEDVHRFEMPKESTARLPQANISRLPKSNNDNQSRFPKSNISAFGDISCFQMQEDRTVPTSNCGPKANEQTTTKLENEFGVYKFFGEKTETAPNMEKSAYSAQTESNNLIIEDVHKFQMPKESTARLTQANISKLPKSNISAFGDISCFQMQEDRTVPTSNCGPKTNEQSTTKLESEFGVFKFFGEITEIAPYMEKSTYPTQTESNNLIVEDVNKFQMPKESTARLTQANISKLPKSNISAFGDISCFHMQEDRTVPTSNCGPKTNEQTTTKLENEFGVFKFFDEKTEITPNMEKSAYPAQTEPNNSLIEDANTFQMPKESTTRLPQANISRLPKSNISAFGDISCFQLQEERTAPTTKYSSKNNEQTTTKLESEFGIFKFLDEKTETAPNMAQVAYPQSIEPNNSIFEDTNRCQMSKESSIQLSEANLLSPPKSCISELGDVRCDQVQEDIAGAALNSGLKINEQATTTIENESDAFKFFDEKTETTPQAVIPDCLQINEENTKPLPEVNDLKTSKSDASMTEGLSCFGLPNEDSSLLKVIACSPPSNISSDGNLSFQLKSTGITYPASGPNSLKEVTLLPKVDFDTNKDQSKSNQNCSTGLNESTKNTIPEIRANTSHFPNFHTSDIGETCNIEISKENTIPLFDPSLYGHSEERQRVINTLNKSLGDFKLFNDTINAAPNMNKSVGPTVATSQTSLTRENGCTLISNDEEENNPKIQNKSQIRSKFETSNEIPSPNSSRLEQNKPTTESVQQCINRSAALLPDLLFTPAQNVSQNALFLQSNQQRPSISCFKIYEDKLESHLDHHHSALIDLSQTDITSYAAENEGQNKDNKAVEPRKELDSSSSSLIFDLKKDSMPNIFLDDSSSSKDNVNLSDALLNQMGKITINDFSFLQSVASNMHIPEESRFSIENPNTELFSIDVATIKNSTILATSSCNKNAQQSQHTLATSFHIKDEMESEGNNATNTQNNINLSIALMSHEVQSDDANMVISEPISIRPSVFQRNSLLTNQKLIDAKVLATSVIEIVDDDDEPENSIYVKQPEKKVPPIIDSELELNANTAESMSAFEQTNLDMSSLNTEEINAELNPFSVDLQLALLRKVHIDDYIKDMPKCQVVQRVPPIMTNTAYVINNDEYDIQEVIGRGSYGYVFSGKLRSDGKVYALKQQRPTNLWEFYICLEIESRIDFAPHILPGFMNVNQALIGKNASVLVSEFSPYGTLLNICNKHKKATQRNLDELIVMLLSTQMLSIIDHLHGANIIHSDIKPDNFLLMRRLSSSRQEPVIQLIDYGRAIDMNHFADKQTFFTQIETENFVCTEMMDGRPWTFQLDLFCVASTIYSVLCGRYMKVEKVKIGEYAIKERIPPHLNVPLWNDLFDTLINIRDCTSLPDLQEVRLTLREAMTAQENMIRDKVAQFNSIIVD